MDKSKHITKFPDAEIAKRLRKFLLEINAIYGKNELIDEDRFSEMFESYGISVFSPKKDLSKVLTDIRNEYQSIGHITEERFRQILSNLDYSLKNKNRRSTLDTIERYHNKLFQKVIRMPEEDKELIEKAADSINESLNKFIVEAAIARAKAILKVSD